MKTTDEVLFSQSDNYNKIQYLLRKGELRKVHTGVYTTNMEDPLENIVGRNWYPIARHLFKGHIISHRSALEMRPSPNKRFYLTGSSDKNVKLPGITFVIRKNTFGEDGVVDMDGSLRRSDEARAFLENLVPSREHNGEKRTVPRSFLETQLVNILNTRGEEGLNSLRDQALTIAPDSPHSKELSDLVSGLLNTKEVSFSSTGAVFASKGIPFDEQRIALFDQLYLTLEKTNFPVLETEHKKGDLWYEVAFYESYFSNHIEGSTLTLEEAEQVIRSRAALPIKQGDSHDMLGTFSYVHDLDRLVRPVVGAEELIAELKEVHLLILKNRPDKLPGQFKLANNQAGDTYFVDKSKVEGTLLKAFERVNNITDPVKKSLYVFFVVSEVHPFSDGNGRTARALMNKFLVEGNRPKIIVPNIYRDDYLLALRQLTRKRLPTGYINAMTRLYSFGHYLGSKTTSVEVKAKLDKHHCFHYGNDFRFTWNHKAYLGQLNEFGKTSIVGKVKDVPQKKTVEVSGQKREVILFEMGTGDDQLQIRVWGSSKVVVNKGDQIQVRGQVRKDPTFGYSYMNADMLRIEKTFETPKSEISLGVTKKKSKGPSL